MRERNTQVVASVAALALLVALASATGCSSGSDGDVLGSGAGNVRVVMTTDGVDPASRDATATVSPSGASAPVELAPLHDDDDDRDRIRLAGAEIEVTDVLARSTTLGQLIPLAIDLPQTVDLLALRDSGGEIEFGIGELEADTYDQLVVVISALTLEGEGGARVTIEPPGGGWTRTIPVAPFTVVEGEVTTIQLMFRMASLRFGFHGDLDDLDDDDFHPEIEIEIEDDDD